MMMRLSRVVLAAGAAVLVACGGSGDPAGTSSNGGSGGSGGHAGGASATTGTGGAEMCPSAGDACTACEASACPQTYCDCYHSAECIALAQCTTKCDPSDVACNQPCWTAHPSAISMGALLVDCAGTHCAAGCPGYKPIGACLTCLYTSCQPEMNACISIPDCTSLLACVAGCTVPGCETSCYQQYPQGAAAAGPVANCTQAHCAAACAP